MTLSFLAGRQLESMVEAFAGTPGDISRLLQSPTLALLSTAEVATERSGEIRLALSGYKSILGSFSRPTAPLSAERIGAILSVTERLRGRADMDRRRQEDEIKAERAKIAAKAAEARALEVEKAQTEKVRAKRRAAGAQFQAETKRLEAKLARQEAMLAAQMRELAEAERTLQALLAQQRAQVEADEEDDLEVLLMVS